MQPNKQMNTMLKHKNFAREITRHFAEHFTLQDFDGAEVVQYASCPADGAVVLPFVHVEAKVGRNIVPRAVLAKAAEPAKLKDLIPVAIIRDHRKPEPFVVMERDGFVDLMSIALKLSAETIYRKFLKAIAHEDPLAQGETLPYVRILAQQGFRPNLRALLERANTLFAHIDKIPVGYSKEAHPWGNLCILGLDGFTKLLFYAWLRDGCLLASSAESEQQPDESEQPPTEQDACKAQQADEPFLFEVPYVLP